MAVSPCPQPARRPTAVRSSADTSVDAFGISASRGSPPAVGGRLISMPSCLFRTEHHRRNIPGARHEDGRAARGHRLPEAYLEAALSPARRLRVPAAPAGGLYLAETAYDLYESKWGAQLRVHREGATMPRFHTPFSFKFIRGVPTGAGNGKRGGSAAPLAAAADGLRRRVLRQRGLRGAARRAGGGLSHPQIHIK